MADETHRVLVARGDSSHMDELRRLTVALEQEESMRRPHVMLWSLVLAVGVFQRWRLIAMVSVSIEIVADSEISNPE